MERVPQVAGTDAIKAFQKAGFNVVRITGSHHIMKRAGHRFVLSVPVHGNRPLKKGTLMSLIHAAGMTEEQFRQLL